MQSKSFLTRILATVLCLALALSYISVMAPHASADGNGVTTPDMGITDDNDLFANATPADAVGIFKGGNYFYDSDSAVTYGDCSIKSWMFGGNASAAGWPTALLNLGKGYDMTNKVLAFNIKTEGGRGYVSLASLHEAGTWAAVTSKAVSTTFKANGWQTVCFNLSELALEGKDMTNVQFVKLGFDMDTNTGAEQKYYIDNVRLLDSYETVEQDWIHMAVDPGDSTAAYNLDMDHVKAENSSLAMKIVTGAAESTYTLSPQAQYGAGIDFTHGKLGGYFYFGNAADPYVKVRLTDVKWNGGVALRMAMEDLGNGWYYGSINVEDIYFFADQTSATKAEIIRVKLTFPANTTVYMDGLTFDDTACSHKTTTTTTVDATCTATGKITETCNYCGNIISETDIPMGEHTYESEVTAPTCTEKGYTTYTCAVCGHSYTANEVEALGHSYSSVVTYPTDTTGGYTTHTCSVCGHSYVDSETAPYTYPVNVMEKGTCATATLQTDVANSGDGAWMISGNVNSTYLYPAVTMDIPYNISDHVLIFDMKVDGLPNGGNVMIATINGSWSASVSIGSISDAKGWKSYVVDFPSNPAGATELTKFSLGMAVTANTDITFYIDNMYLVKRETVEDDLIHLTPDVGPTYCNAAFFNRGDMLKAENSTMSLQLDMPENGMYTFLHETGINWAGGELGAWFYFGDAQPQASMVFTASNWSVSNAAQFTFGEGQDGWYYGTIDTWEVMFKSKAVGSDLTAVIRAQLMIPAAGTYYIDGLSFAATECKHGDFITTTVDATCTAAGSVTESCVYCGEILNVTEIEMLPHSYNAVVTPATSTSDGYTTYTCTVCGHSYQDDFIPANNEAEFDMLYEANLVYNSAHWTEEKGLSYGVSHEETNGELSYQSWGFHATAAVEQNAVAQMQLKNKYDATKCKLVFDAKATVATDLQVRLHNSGWADITTNKTQSIKTDGWNTYEILLSDYLISGKDLTDVKFITFTFNFTANTGSERSVYIDNVHLEKYETVEDDWINLTQDAGSYYCNSTTEIAKDMVKAEDSVWSLKVVTPADKEGKFTFQHSGLNLAGGELGAWFYFGDAEPHASVTFTAGNWKGSVPAAFSFGEGQDGWYYGTVDTWKITFYEKENANGVVSDLTSAIRVQINLPANGTYYVDGLNFVNTECGHGKQTTTTVDATCTAAGSITVTCDYCGTVISTEEIAMLEHTYTSEVTVQPTATKEGVTTYTCTECGHSYTEAIDPIGIGTLRFKSAALSLENNLTIRFVVDGSLFIEDAYTQPFAVFTVGVKTQTVYDYVIDANGDYVFSCTNISPSQMGDVVCAELHATLEGQEYMASMEYSVATYCYNQLSKSQDAKLRTLLVDLLNYGEASQIYTTYRDTELVTAQLTAEQKAWGTAADPALSSCLNTKYSTVENAKVKWKAAALTLESDITMRFRFAAESIEGLSVKIEIGGNVYYSSEFVADPENAGQYYVAFNGVVARQMRDTVLVTVYEGDIAVSNTLSYSVETYAYNKQNDEKLGALVKAMIRYSDSAASYLN